MVAHCQSVATMAESAFPRRTSDPATDRCSTVVSVQEADGLITALSSGMGREILTVLHEDAMPPSDVAEAVGTSIQNVTYHLDRLQEAGLVRVIDTWYSSRGREMDVYALVSDPIMLCIGDPRETADTAASDERRGSGR